MMLSEKDIISLNEEYANGHLINPGSLHYAHAIATKTRNWTRSCAHLARALLIDHAFENGNKRTALAIVIIEAYNNGHDINSRKLGQAFLRITKKNNPTINTIDEAIHDAIQ
jgi:hypothetical protein